MTISRRGFIAGLALTGAAVPAAFYAHRELTREEEFPITPGEATVDLADTAGQHLANTLRGVWSLRLEGRDAGLKGLPLHGLELLLDTRPPWPWPARLPGHRRQPAQRRRTALPRAG